jgi:hypothetical protein
MFVLIKKRPRAIFICRDDNVTATGMSLNQARTPHSSPDKRRKNTGACNFSANKFFQSRIWALLSNPQILK